MEKLLEKSFLKIIIKSFPPRKEKNMGKKQKEVTRFYDFLKYGLETDDLIVGRHLLNLVGLKESELADEKVLEVGVGRGNWTMMLAPNARFYVGADISLESLKHVKRKYTKNLVNADISALPYPSDCFDRVFAIGVLPAVEKQREGFKELARVLKPGGIMHLFLYGRVFPRNMVRDFIHHALNFFSMDKKRKICYRFALLSKYKIPESLLFRSDMEFVILDWYLAPIQNRHTYRQIKRWMKEENIKPISFTPYPHPSSFAFHRLSARLPILGEIISPDFFAKGIKNK